MSKESIVQLEDIIAWKVQQIQNKVNEPMPLPMQQALEVNNDWRQELSFVEHFYTSQADEQRPSAQLSTRFYQMLNSAQVVQEQRVHNTKNNAGEVRFQPGIWQAISSWFMPAPVYQFAMLAVCFGLGWYLKPIDNNTVATNHESQQISALQNEVKSLTTMVAVSMLQNPSATERLNGIAYSASLIDQEPQIQQTLLKVLATDDSTSVKLAALKSLAEIQNIAPIADALIDVLNTERNPLVQINVLQMLLLSGNEDVYLKTTNQLTNTELSTEASKILEQLSQVNQI
ncbi:MAG: hypothetical protein GJ680_02670 [Alteromonadaceae bacterium]|nr:hypothetical protein [Alteromonadaceae bacterium]